MFLSCTQRCQKTCWKMRKIDLKRVIFTGKNVIMRYFTTILFAFVAVLAGFAAPHTGTCHYACKCECGHHYCDWCGKCANEHHRDCECECHKDAELYTRDVNAACRRSCDKCEMYHLRLERQHDIWLSYQKKQKRQAKQNVRPQQKKTTPQPPRQDNGRSAVRQQHR